MSVTKKLIFKSNNLGDNVTLMLCFTPPSHELYRTQFPIAWKVTTLAAKGRSQMNATWTSTLGFAAAQVGAGQLVTAGSYTPIMPGESTTLTVDQTQSPPVYNWTTPKKLAGVKAVQAINGTGGYAGIGLGFITNLDTPLEDMNTAIMYDHVGAGMSVTGEFTPVLKAYIALDYKETQIIKAEIQSGAIWEKNLLSLGASTTIVISKNAMGGYEAQTLGANVGNDKDIPLWKSIDSGLFSTGQRLYEVTLAFKAKTRDDVVPIMLPILSRLLDQGYKAKIVQKEYDTDIHLDIWLPFNASCADAEAQLAGFIWDDRLAIRERGGAIRLYESAGFSYMVDINPASSAWTERNSFVTEKEGANGDATPAAIANEFDGMAIGNGDIGSPMAYGKTRVGGKKGPSSVVSSIA
ncbi:hypothetical protein C8Q80DRAFT_1192287 [Daedaleopsis nitida]|nr:hypothetical protein C8Q80DRAFT_1192287 [Daedaleopsis nitida]